MYKCDCRISLGGQFGDNVYFEPKHKEHLMKYLVDVKDSIDKSYQSGRKVVYWIGCEVIVLSWEQARHLERFHNIPFDRAMQGCEEQPAPASFDDYCF